MGRFRHKLYSVVHMMALVGTSRKWNSVDNGLTDYSEPLVD